MINLHGLNKLRAMGYTQEVEEIEAELTLLRAVAAAAQKLWNAKCKTQWSGVYLMQAVDDALAAWKRKNNE